MFRGVKLRQTESVAVRVEKGANVTLGLDDGVVLRLFEEDKRAEEEK